MSWRGVSGGIEAAKAGHDVIMTPGTHCYFDHYQADPAFEPLAIGGLTTFEKVYSFNPVPVSYTHLDVYKRQGSAHLHRDKISAKGGPDGGDGGHGGDIICRGSVQMLSLIHIL